MHTHMFTCPQNINNYCVLCHLLSSLAYIKMRIFPHSCSCYADFITAFNWLIILVVCSVFAKSIVFARKGFPNGTNEKTKCTNASPLVSAYSLAHHPVSFNATTTTHNSFSGNLKTHVITICNHKVKQEQHWIDDAFRAIYIITRSYLH